MKRLKQAGVLLKAFSRLPLIPSEMFLSCLIFKRSWGKKKKRKRTTIRTTGSRQRNKTRLLKPTQKRGAHSYLLGLFSSRLCCLKGANVGTPSATFKLCDCTLMSYKICFVFPSLLVQWR